LSEKNQEKGSLDTKESESKRNARRIEILLEPAFPSSFLLSVESLGGLKGAGGGDRERRWTGGRSLSDQQKIGTPGGERLDGHNKKTQEKAPIHR